MNFAFSLGRALETVCTHPSSTYSSTSSAENDTYSIPLWIPCCHWYATSRIETVCTTRQISPISLGSLGHRNCSHASSVPAISWLQQQSDL